MSPQNTAIGAGALARGVLSPSTSLTGIPCLRFAPVRSAPGMKAVARTASAKFASVKVAPLTSAPVRIVPLTFASVRIAPRSELFATRESFSPISSNSVESPRPAQITTYSTITPWASGLKPAGQIVFALAVANSKYAPVRFAPVKSA